MIIHCDWCGSAFETKNNPVCPHCGGAWDKDQEAAAVREEEARQARRAEANATADQFIKTADSVRQTIGSVQQTANSIRGAADKVGKVFGVIFTIFFLMVFLFVFFVFFRVFFAF